MPESLSDTRSDPRMTGEAFVEVHDEPLHRFRFKNEFVHVYDVLIPPGGLSLYHRHAQDTLYINFADARVTSQRQGEEVVAGATKKGFSTCLCHRNTPLIHQVGNVGDEEMHLLGAEAKARPPITTAEPLRHEGHELIWESERIRAYRVLLPPGVSLGEADYHFSGLFVFLSTGCLAQSEAGGPETVKWISAGDWIWQDGPRRLALRNAGETELECILAEWI